MGFADSLKAETLTKGPTCTVCTLLPNLDKADADALTAAMSNPSIPATTISRALKREGHNISDSTVRRHSRGGCATA